MRPCAGRRDTMQAKQASYIFAAWKVISAGWVWYHLRHVHWVYQRCHSAVNQQASWWASHASTLRKWGGRSDLERCIKQNSSSLGLVQKKAPPWKKGPAAEPHAVQMFCARWGARAILGAGPRSPAPEAGVMPRGQAACNSTIPRAPCSQGCAGLSVRRSRSHSCQTNRVSPHGLDSQRCKLALSSGQGGFGHTTRKAWSWDSPPHHHHGQSKMPLQHTTPVGSGPTRGDPIGLAGRRLSRSAKVSSAQLAWCSCPVKEDPVCTSQSSPVLDYFPPLASY